MSENKKIVMYDDEGEIVFVKNSKDLPEGDAPWINGKSRPVEGYTLWVFDEDDMDEEEGLPEYDQDEAVEFIKAKFEEDGQSEVTNGVIRKLLDADEDYMRSKGIIEE